MGHVSGSVAGGGLAAVFILIFSLLDALEKSPAPSSGHILRLEAPVASPMRIAAQGRGMAEEGRPEWR